MRELIRRNLKLYLEEREIKWTEEKLRDEARKYDRLSDFQKGSGSAYTMARRKGADFFYDITSHLSPGKTRIGLGLKSQKNKKSDEPFIVQAEKKHGKKYDYSEVDYKNTSTPVKIICPEHGEFFQKPFKHLSGQGCKKCYEERKSEIFRKTKEEFIKNAQEIHKKEDGTPKYDYSKVNYVNNQTEVVIICPLHGDFSQKPNNHLKGNRCPICNESKGEELIAYLLHQKNINFIRQKKFLDCTNKKIGISCRKLPFDFYLPNNNICIEYDGKQHYEPVNVFGGNESFENQIVRDKIKDEYCKKKGIKLIRIPYTMSPEEIETYLLMELGIAE